MKYCGKKNAESIASSTLKLKISAYDTLAGQALITINQTNMDATGLTESAIEALKNGAYNKIADSSNAYVDMYDYMVKETATSIYICISQQDLVMSTFKAYALMKNLNNGTWAIQKKTL